MAGRMSAYLKAALLNETLRGVAYAAPANVYLSLHTAEVTEAGVGAETTDEFYARSVITFSAPVAGVATNDSTVTVDALGKIIWWGLWDANTAGNLLYFGPFDIPRTLAGADTAYVPAASIEITLD